MSVSACLRCTQERKRENERGNGYMCVSAFDVFRERDRKRAFVYDCVIFTERGRERMCVCIYFCDI